LNDLRAGGAERMMLNLAGGIADAGYAVDMVLVEAVGDYLSQVPKTVRIVDLKHHRTVSSIPALARYLRRERPVAMLSALMHVNVSALLAMYLAGRCCRVVVSERTTISQEAGKTTALSIRAAYKLVPWLYPRADGIVTVSQGAAEDLARFCHIPIERVAVVNNPVVSPALLQRAAEPVDHPWFAPGQPPVILAVGRLSPEKEFDTLIRAFAELAQRRPARLMILGDGTRRKQLEQLIQQLELGDLVALPGFTSNPYAYMNRADIFVLSSRFEGFGNVLAEAMALGTPVVSTDCPHGPREILNDGEYGALVPVGDPRALANAIIQTLNRPVDSQRLKERSNEFTINTVSEKYIQLFSKLVRHTY